MRQAEYTSKHQRLATELRVPLWPELVGGENAFIDGSDYSSLHAGAIDLARSTLTLRGGRNYGSGVALTSFALDQGAASVPEPMTWSMLVAGFLLTGFAVRRREYPTA